MNSVQIVGRLTADVEVRKTQTSQKSFARFTVAVRRPWSKDSTDFIRCVAWEKAADLMGSQKKGRQIAINGWLQTGKGERDGVKYDTADVVVERITFIEPKAAEPAKPAAEEAEPEEPKFDIAEDDLPF